MVTIKRVTRCPRTLSRRGFPVKVDLAICPFERCPEATGVEGMWEVTRQPKGERLITLTDMERLGRDPGYFPECWQMQRKK